MIITRSPLRISLGGGGTDLPSYYREHGGFVVSAAIDKYVFITLLETFQQEFLIKYSQTEVVQTVSEIKHPIIREALRLVPSGSHLEIVSLSDIPAGTGLGSSGSFTVALLRALHTRIDGVRERAFQLGLGLHQVHLGRDAGGVAVLRQVERPLERGPPSTAGQRAAVRQPTAGSPARRESDARGPG